MSCDDLVKGKPDAFLARLMREHPERADMAPVIIRVADADGVLRFAAVLESFGGKRKIKEFSGGTERWIDAHEMIEAC